MSEKTPLSQPETTSLERARPSATYLSWPSFTDICLEKPVNGLMEKRGGALFDSDREALVERMRLYHDQSVGWRDFAVQATGLEEKRSRFDPEKARKLVLDEGYSDKNIRKYAFKPFDDRWCYYSEVRPLWNDPRPKLEEWQRIGNEFIIARPERIGGLSGVPVYYTRSIGDCDLLHGYAYFFPMFVQQSRGGGLRPNLSRQVLDYLARLGIKDAATNADAARMVWSHALAIAYSSAYLAENAAGVEHGYPRVPFPSPNEANGVSVEFARGLFQKSADLGCEVAQLLDAEPHIEGVTTENDDDVRIEFQRFGKLTSESKDESKADEIPLRGWGRVNGRKAVLPTHGPILQRYYSPFEREDIEEGALERGLHVGAAYGCLGDETFDVHLNENWYWRNIPARVWDYTIGGYPVLRKWLSYRDVSVTGRALNREELTHFTQMVRRLAALRLLEPRLNRSYAMIRDCAHI